MRALIVPDRLAAACRGTPDRMAWLDRLPDAIRELQDRWLLSLAAPFDGGDVSCAWVAPAVRRGGTGAVLKLGMLNLEVHRASESISELQRGLRGGVQAL